MTYDVFRSGEQAQRRYWSRAFVGWQHMGGAEPNDGHRALVELERLGAVTGIITQNVDGLHTRAGAERVIDLHGRIGEVVCLGCRDVTSRVRLQARLATLNPTYADADTSDVEIAPDGDALVDDCNDFVLAGCERCGGPLKPHVVFFGENVPRPRVERAIAMVDSAEVLLVVGSSLTVMSGLRFVRQAAKAGTPVVIVNRGATRGDDRATIKLEAGCSPTLRAYAKAAARVPTPGR
jgi:NAD-dependent SIR2 family protein deacetylase